MSSPEVIQVKRLKTVADLEARLAELGVGELLGVDEHVDPVGPLGEGFSFEDATAGRLDVGNRFTVLPMEGWDGGTDGSVTDLVRRRWVRFGESGAKLVWGGEAVAVVPEGRANPNQLVISEATVEQIASLRDELVSAHVASQGSDDGLVVGLQLTHSGRWSRPEGSHAPRIAYRHPVLDARVGAGDADLLSDDELDALVERYVAAGVLAARAGFDFVDLKHCHGYLLHELLGAVDRPGRFGGSLENRTAVLRRVVAGLRVAVPSLAIGVRLSAFDFVPFEPGPDGVGVPSSGADDAPRYAFGGGSSGLEVDLSGAHRFLDILEELGIGIACITAGSPYYNPHIQRPAFFPPSDGYTPPEDPLVGVARQVAATAELARAHPRVALVGSGYSYLQQWLPNVAQHVVRHGAAASIGLGRSMLSYPHLPADVLAGESLKTPLICRSFSDCTTAPRNGLVSGCYPIDDFYKQRPERIELAAIKKATRRRTARGGDPADAG